MDDLLIALGLWLLLSVGTAVSLSWLAAAARRGEEAARRPLR